MKKVLVLLLVIITLFACSSDDNSTLDKQIIGEWKLMKAETVFSPSTSIIDYSNKNIIYNFRSDGKLVVSGGENIGYPDGEYDYYFGKDYFGGTTDPKILLVKINNTKWTYNLTDGEMKLGQSYVDGPDLFFKRK